MTDIAQERLRLLNRHVTTGMTDLERLTMLNRYFTERSLTPFVFGGSAAMLIHGIDRELGDIDVFMATRPWFTLKDIPSWKVWTTEPDDPKRCCDPPYMHQIMNGKEVCVFHAWRVRPSGLSWIDTSHHVSHHLIVNGLHVVSLNVLLAWKRAAGRDKDQLDIDLIERKLCPGGA